MAKPHKEYIKLKRAFLAGKRCAVFPFLKATEVHHIRGRLGPLLTDQRYWLAVSRLAHQRIHANLSWARANGYIAKPGQWNRTPRTSHRKTLQAKGAASKVDV